MPRVNQKVWFALILCLFFLYGLLVYRDYGSFPDDLWERNSSLITYRQYFPSLSETVTDTVDFSTLPDLKDYSERYYGTALQGVCVAIEHLTGFTMTFRQILYLRHLYVFLWFLLAAACFYGVCKKVFHKSKTLPIIGMLALILMPRILADSFYNIKDSLFLSIFVVNLFACILFLEKQNGWRMVFFAITSAFCINTRIVGVILFVFCLLGVWIKAAGERNRRALALGFGSLILGYTLYVILTPALWENPISESIALVKHFAHYPGWKGSVFFQGDWYGDQEIPKQYLFIWILISTPAVYLLYFVLGALRYFWQLKQTVSITYGASSDPSPEVASLNTIPPARRKTKRPSQMRSLNFLFCAMVAPLAYALIGNPTLYNGWRHFYFIYPLLVLFLLNGLQGAQNLVRNLNRVKWLPNAILFLSMGLTVFWIARNHPLECVYFNPLARNYGMMQFERDYWGLSEKQCIQFILDQDNGSWIKIAAPFKTDTNYLFSEEDQKRFIVVSDSKSNEYDYCFTHVASGEEENTYSDPLYLFDEIYTAKVDRYPVRSVYKRVYRSFCESQLVKKEGDFYHSLQNIRWVESDADGNNIFTGHLIAGTKSDLFTITCKREEILKYATFAVSENGQDWEIIPPDSVDQTGNTLVIHTPYQTFREVRIYVPVTYSNYQIKVDIYEKKEETENGEKAKSPIVFGKVNDHEDLMSQALDGKQMTSWNGVVYPGRETYFMVQLDETYPLKGVAMLQENAEAAEVANVSFQASGDGVNWEDVPVLDRDSSMYYLNPVQARYLKITVDGSGYEEEQSWKIYELLLFQ